MAVRKGDNTMAQPTRQMRNESNMVIPDGRKVRRLRKKSLLTQEELAKKAGYALRTIQRIEQGEPTYPRTLSEVAQVLETTLEDLIAGGHGGSEGGIAEPIEKHVISFDTFIEDRTEGFVGRKFALDALDAFLDQESSGYFIVRGQPGIGKSAFLAWCVKTRGWKIHHFNMGLQGICRPRQFLGNVCARLIATYGLSHEEVPEDSLEDGALLNNLLREAAGQLQKGERLIVAIDALDEVEPQSANALFLPASLPENVFVVLTTRPGPDAALPIMTSRLCDLEADSAANLRDIRTYIKVQAADDEMEAWILEHDMALQAFVETMLKKSEGNFMYLRHVLPEIARGVYTDLGLEDLPRGLKGYYEDHWHRMGMTAKPLPRSKIKIVYVLSAVRHPVSRVLLADFAQEDEVAVQEVLDEWQAFLHKERAEGDMRYSMYHTSFRDFLYRKDIVQAAGVNVRDINKGIADNLWDELIGEE